MASGPKILNEVGGLMEGIVNLAPEMHSPMFAFSSELSIFLGNAKTDPFIVTFLTDVYDNPDEFIYDLVSDGDNNIRIISPYLSLLGCSTIDFLNDALPPSAIGGGFMARIIQIHQEDVRQRVAWPDPDFSMEDKLVEILKKINKMRGQFVISDELREAYKLFYAEHCKTAKDVKDAHTAGYFERKPTHVLKLMMILAASDEFRMNLRVSDLTNAIAILDPVEEMMPKIMGSLGLTDHGGLGANADFVYRVIQQNFNISRTDLLKQCYRRGIRRDALTEICGTLEEAGVIKTIAGGWGELGVGKTRGSGGTHYQAIGPGPDEANNGKDKG
jgi:hypothetical protein